MWYLMFYKSQHKHELHEIEIRRRLENIPAQWRRPNKKCHPEDFCQVKINQFAVCHVILKLN